MNNEKDYIIRATAADGMIRAFAATSKNTVETARQLHGMSPVATAALGRLITAAQMMGSDMKNDRDLLTLRINCDGPIGGLLVTADNQGRAKGYVNNPTVMLPPNSKGKLDVGGALDLGVLSVIRDTGLKEPYVGQTILVTSEIAEDLTYYFAVSEQVPSTVALGVLMNKDNTVRQAGGFIIQLMPGASDEIIDRLETRVGGIDSITSMLDKDMSPEDILGFVLGDFDLIINDRTDSCFQCDCSKERVSRALLSIGKKDLQELVDEGEDVEMQCHFCNKKYVFTPQEITSMLKASDSMLPEDEKSD
ncbi:MAG: Hsp33 family molecular chaperone HslO [Clostridiales bacterium]|nr:Hsp33 family molecular chaperone HslO [Clostridiales bacterium]